MLKANQDIRSAINKANTRHWQVAYSLGVSDGHFARMLRRELPAEQKQQIMAVIKELQQAQ